MPSAGFAYARWRFCRRSLFYLTQRKKRAMPSAGFAYAHWRFCRRSLFLSHAKAQRKRRGRSHAGDFAGDRFF
ncbi:MAG: hypothetical protein V7K27_28780 [Nostoc sp.]|uniref:hypothetical protein n=1 Tax=Nostoc sp. TaxID=1180 RepID=UPI002FF4CF30